MQTFSFKSITYGQSDQAKKPSEKKVSLKEFINPISSVRNSQKGDFNTIKQIGSAGKSGMSSVKELS